MSVRPPPTISMHWCPVCGRDDRLRPFTGTGHFSRGERCPGTPHIVTYTLKAAAREGV